MEIKQGMFMKMHLEATNQNMDFHVDTLKTLRKKLDEIYNTRCVIEESMKTELDKVRNRVVGDLQEALKVQTAAQMMLKMSDMLDEMR